MQSIKGSQIAFVAGSAVTLLLAGVFLKNYFQQKNFVPIDRELALKVLKFIRKQNYTVLTKIAPMVHQMKSMQNEQMQLTPEIIESQLNNPMAGINLTEQIQKNKKKALTHFNVDQNSFSKTLDLLTNDQNLYVIRQKIAQDYSLALSGKAIRFPVKPPTNFTPQRILHIIEQTSRQTHLAQVSMFRKMKDLSEDDLNNPQIMKDMELPADITNKILQEEGFGNDEEPAAAVFQAAMITQRNNPHFAKTTRMISEVYDKTLQRYAMKMQSKKITQQELHSLQTELKGLKVLPN